MGKKKVETIVVDGEVVQGEIHVPEADDAVVTVEVPLPDKLQQAFENAYTNAQVTGRGSFVTNHENDEWVVTVERYDWKV